MTYAHQHNLGSLIRELADLPPTARVRVEGHEGPEDPGGVGSYRGDYSQLMLERAGDRAWTVRELLKVLRDANGRMFQGYKGGEYRMTFDTPVFIDTYGGASRIACASPIREIEGGYLIPGFEIGDIW